jgi:hypothetical protein
VFVHAFERGIAHAEPSRAIAGSHPQPGFRSGTMPRSKMKGDNSANSKGADSEARGSGGTTKKSQNAGKQSNQKAANTKSNTQ